jgi:hypothetical protein
MVKLRSETNDNLSKFESEPQLFKARTVFKEKGGSFPSRLYPLTTSSVFARKVRYHAKIENGILVLELREASALRRRAKS